MRLVECVPNISEGQDDSVIDAITKAASESGAHVLHIDRGRSTNRTVITFIADPGVAREAAFSLIKRASELIDMRKHKGAHPRIGAADVFPFVPLDGVSMDECVDLARQVGKRVAEELAIPVYLYGEAATSPEREKLGFLRQGEYEGIPAKFKDPALAPDFGEALFNEKSGVTVIGARSFLIAYNINLDTQEKRFAQEIAYKIRRSGRKKRRPDGSIFLDSKGRALIEPGLFSHCAAIGWVLDQFGIAQVSTNLTNFEVNSIEDIYDAVCHLASELGVRVRGSEIVGLLPKKALIRAGQHYLRKSGANIELSERELYQIAIKSLGLNDLYPFVVEEKVLEERMKMDESLAN